MTSTRLRCEAGPATQGQPSGRRRRRRRAGRRGRVGGSHDPGRGRPARCRADDVVRPRGQCRRARRSRRRARRSRSRWPSSPRAIATAAARCWASPTGCAACSSSIRRSSTPTGGDRSRTRPGGGDRRRHLGARRRRPRRGRRDRASTPPSTPSSSASSRSKTRTVDIDHSALEGHPTLQRLSGRLADLFDRAAFDRGLTALVAAAHPSSTEEQG